MATTATPYGTLLTDLGFGVHQFGTDTDKVALLKSTYVPDLELHDQWTEVSAQEVTGSGYTPGGKTLTGVTLTLNTPSLAVLAAAAITWTGLTATFQYAVVYNADAGKLIGLINFGEERTYAGEDFQLTFPSGVLKIQRPA